MKYPAITLALSICACTVGDEILTYEQFEAQAYRDPETDMRFVDGDTPVATDVEMRLVYDDYLASIYDEPLATPSAGLVVNEKAGRVDKWSPGEARDLRYCISKDKFGAFYPLMVSTANAAAADWEAAANVNFIHVASADDSCDRNTPGVKFNIRFTCERRDFYARAFFPTTERGKRQIVIHCDMFTSPPAPETAIGIMRHELGHTLGFRHEQVRPQAGACREGGHWRPLTGYDAKSVMHYRECNGKNKGDLLLTDKDKRGARELYPF